MAKLSTMAIASSIAVDARLYGYDPSETNPSNRTKAFLISDIVNSVRYPVQAGEVGVTNTLYPVGNVKRYGAAGNGIGDDTLAFRAAVTAVVTLGTYLVTVPEGTFNLTGSIVLQSSVKVVGLGGNQSRVVFNFAGGIGFYGSGVSNCAVDYIGISGLLSMGVVYNQSTKVRVRGCDITGCTSATHPTAYAGAIHAWVCDDVEVSDNYLIGNGYISNSPASTDIQINGNGLNVGSKRVKIINNRCLSVAAQSNIAAYDVQQSEISGNVCTGAKTGSGNNNGYGIMIYRSVNNSGFCRDNRIENNHVYSVGGTGIYVQSSIRTAVLGNIVFDAGVVQDDTTLGVGGISLNSAYDSTVTGNVLLECGKAGIVFSGATAADISGIVVANNTIETSVANVFCIYIRGPATRCTIGGNTIKGGAHGIATAPVDQGIVGISIFGNNVTLQAGRGINIYGISESTIVSNTVLATGGDAIALVGGSRNTVSQNTAFDGSTTLTNTYFGIDLSLILDSVVEGNIVGNTGGVGFKHGIFVPANCTGNVVKDNHCKGNLTTNYNVDTSVASGNAFYGNYDAGGTFSQFFGMRQQAVIQGAASAITQLLLGDSSSSGAVGTMFSGGDTFLSQNAKHNLTGDSWHQNNAAAASKLLVMRSNGDLEFYSVAAGTADGTFAAFWGALRSAFTAAGQIKTSSPTFLKSTIALSNGAAAATATLTNAPIAGNPTKWIPVDDNGTIRSIPAW